MKAKLELKQIPFLLAFGDIANKKPSFGKNLDTLDGLRGLAVMLVIASHTDGLHLHGLGGLGVWIFFTLSGFLLTYPFTVMGKELNTFGKLAEFWGRRIKRIFPMYYFILVLVFIFKTGDLINFLQHIFFLRGDGHFWSIPQELLFYLLLPVLLFLINKIARRRYVIGALILLTIGIGANIFLTVDVFHLSQDNINLPFYLMPFCVGSATSFLLASPKIEALAQNKYMRVLIPAIGGYIVMLFFVAAEYYFTRLSVYLPILASLKISLSWNYVWFFSLLSGMLILSITLQEDSILGKIFRRPILRVIGLISFSMYLIHPFIISVIQPHIQSSNLLFLATTIATIAFSLFTYGLIERPFTIGLRPQKTN